MEIERYFQDAESDAIELLRKKYGLDIDDDGKLKSSYVFDRTGGDHPNKYIPLSERDEYSFINTGLLMEGSYAAIALDLDIPTEDNTSEVDALKECVDNRDILSVKGFEGVEDYELFAVLAILKIACAIPHAGYYSKSKDDDVSYVSACAIEAMDAVCYAEHLFDTEQLREDNRLANKHWSEMLSKYSQSNKELRKLSEAHEHEIKRVSAEYEAEKAAQKKLRSDRLSAGRHQKGNEAKGLVTTEWEKAPSKFISATKAGEYFSGWLKEKGVEFEPRTVTGWISAHAKQKGINLR